MLTHKHTSWLGDVPQTKSIDLTLFADHKKHETGATRRKMSIMCSHVFLTSLHHFNTPLLPHPHLSLFQCSREQSTEWGYKQMSCDCNRPGPVLLTPGDSVWWPRHYKRTERKTKNMNTECGVNWRNISERLETESESEKKKERWRWRLCP